METIQLLELGVVVAAIIFEEWPLTEIIGPISVAKLISTSIYFVLVKFMSWIFRATLLSILNFC
jgi:hypothetical protein